MAVVLIVEDDLFTLGVAEILIREFGYDTLSASDVHEASELLRSSRTVDALFTDINLKSSVTGGCELAHLAIRLRPKLGVLYATGNVITDVMKSTFVEDAAVLRKPYTQAQLQAALARLLPP